jgi:predicted DsbA family dithiol-disulfide isomerase
MGAFCYLAKRGFSDAIEHFSHREAAPLGINGVPFSIFVHKYTISGAQQMSTFASALEQSYAERTRAASTA